MGALECVIVRNLALSQPLMNLWNKKLILRQIEIRNKRKIDKNSLPNNAKIKRLIKKLLYFKVGFTFFQISQHFSKFVSVKNWDRPKVDAIFWNSCRQNSFSQVFQLYSLWMLNLEALFPSEKSWQATKLQVPLWKCFWPAREKNLCFKKDKKMSSIVVNVKLSKWRKERS